MVKPPVSGPRKQAKVYPPLEAYLRNLLLVRLEPTASSVAFVSKQLIRFPWNDPSQQCGLLVCKYMLKTCRKGRYKSIQAIASVAASLRRQKPEIFSRLVDAVLEELQWSLEHPDFRDQQRVIAYTRLLGELYCASLASAQLIFYQLYHFINFGHQIPDALRAACEKSSKEEADQSGLLSSAGKVSQTIHEDEEMVETDGEQAIELPAPPKPVAVSKHSKFDPRVPSPLDPPNSAMRIKLVCTLLEVVVKSLLTRNNLPKMEGFLAAFQRYLFTKPSLPTEVEFSLLDVFDSVDSRWKKAQQDAAVKVKRGDDADEKDHQLGFPRFTNWLDAHNATVAVEEAEAILEARTQSLLESLAGESQVDSEMLSVDDLATEDPDEEESDQESMDDPLSASAKDSYVDDEMESDMETDEDEKANESEESEEEDSEESNESGEEEEEDDSQEEEFDEEAYMRQLEEEAFERELRRVTMEALEKGKNAVRGQVADTMPSGSQFIKKKSPDAAPEIQGAQAVALGGKEGVTFQLLKKGNKGKMEVKQLIVPVDTNLAKLATKQDDEAARERDLIKARVLRYEAESAESEYAGGNVYLEQEKLQVIRNRPLSMEEIDKNFGTSGGNRRSADKSKQTAQIPGGRGPAAQSSGGRGILIPQSLSGGRGGVGSSTAPAGGPVGAGAPAASFTGRGGRAGRGRGNPGGRSLFH